MHGLIRGLVTASVLQVWVGCALAGPAALEFSAEARQLAPQRAAQAAQMYVSEKAVRTEYVLNGQRVAQIAYPDEMKSVLLFLERREYMQQAAPAGGVEPTKAPEGTDSPCAGVPNVTCTKLGEEQVNGRSASKWEFVSEQGGRQARSLHWIDLERRMPVREIFPDGTASELRKIGTETLNGRQVEKWELSVTRPDGQSQSRMQWYDPQLQIAVREEMPGGFVRELVNIKVGKQPAELFEIPDGFRQISPPPVAGTGQGPMGVPSGGYR